MECSNCSIVYSDILDCCPNCGTQAGSAGDHPDKNTVVDEVSDDATIVAGSMFGDNNFDGSKTSDGYQDETVVMDQSFAESQTAGERYEIIKEIGKGSFGKVYLGQDKRMFDKKVAIKHISSEFYNRKGISTLARNNLKEQFVKEPKALVNLQHPNIVYIYDVLENADGLQIVMEYVDGGTLKKLVKKNGVLDDADVLKIGISICDALSEVHEENIVHRDIKPANILMTKRGTPKLIDFGLVLDKDTDISKGLGSTMGSPPFMSPEQKKDSMQVDLLSDIYSLGATLYYAMCGYPPNFKQKDEGVLSDSVSHVILKSLEEDPKNRYQDATAFKNAMKDALLNFNREKDTDTSKHEFPCYSCSNSIPGTAVFCSFCGKDVQEVRKEKEKLFDDIINGLDKDVSLGKFDNAINKLNASKKDFDHQHFAHFQTEIDKKKEWVRRKLVQANELKVELLGYVDTAEHLINEKDYDAAKGYIKRIKRNDFKYYNVVSKKADDLSRMIDNILSEGDSLKKELTKVKSNVSDIALTGEFDQAKHKIRTLIKSIDGSLYSDVLVKAEESLEWVLSQEREGEEKRKVLNEKLGAAKSFFDKLNFTESQRIAKELSTAKGKFYQKIVDEANKITHDISSVSKKRENYEKKLKDAGEQAEKEEFSRSFALIEEVLSENTKPYEDLRNRAKEKKLNIQEQKNAYEDKIKLDGLTTKFNDSLKEAKENPKQAKTLLKPVLESLDPELDSLRIQANSIIKRVVVKKRIKMLSFLLMVATLSLSVVNYEAFLLWGTDVSVLTKQANIRKGPDTSFPVVATFTKNTRMKATWIRKSPAKNPWLRVTVPGNESAGFVSLKVLLNHNGRLPFTDGVISKNNTKMFFMGSRNSWVIKTLQKGDNIYLTDWSIDKKYQLWYEVYHKNEKGYISSGNVRLKTSFGSFNKLIEFIEHNRG